MKNKEIDVLYFIENGSINSPFSMLNIKIDKNVDKVSKKS